MRYDNHLGRAKQEARKAVSNLHQGERGEVLAVGAHIQFLAQPVGDADQLRAAIGAIQPSDSRSSYGEFAMALRPMSQLTHMPLEVHCASDMQNSALPPAFA